MEIYKLELEMAGLFHGGTTEKAQSSWLRLNGDSFKVVGRDFPYDRPKKLAQEVATQLERDYSVVLKRDALRTLQELIKVGQGLEKERREKLTFRTSGRKAASNKPEREVGGVPRAMQEAQPNLVQTPSIEPRPASSPSPISPPASAGKPHIFTMVRDEVSGDNPLKPVLMSYVKGVDVAELKRTLGQVAGDWRAVQVPDDCRAALEWVDAQ